ncbi:hypothetical protein D3C86_1928010 [compost metagenome]
MVSLAFCASLFFFLAFNFFLHWNFANLANIVVNHLFVHSMTGSHHNDGASQALQLFVLQHGNVSACIGL